MSEESNRDHGLGGRVESEDDDSHKTRRDENIFYYIFYWIFESFGIAEGERRILFAGGLQYCIHITREVYRK